VAEEIRLYAPRTRLAVFAATSLVFVLVGLWIAGVIGGEPMYGPVGVIAGWFAAVVFGVFTPYLLYRLVTRRPSLVIGHDGIVDHATATSVGTVGWEEIAEVGLRDFAGQRMIVIAVRDEEALLARQNPVNAVLMRVNKGLNGSMVNIPHTALEVSVEEALAHIERFREATST